MNSAQREREREREKEIKGLEQVQSCLSTFCGDCAALAGTAVGTTSEDGMDDDDDD